MAMANAFYQYRTTLSSKNETSGEESSEEESAEGESSDEESSEECLESFRRFFREDVTVFQLYKRQVREIKKLHGIRTSESIEAVFSMIRTISKGHKHSFQRFSGLDFNEPRNRCAYLLRYATCHTGLVRKAMWNIFQRELLFVDKLKNKDELNIVSLGGGPGNDILGFCSALQEFSNCVTSFDFTVVDIKDGWSGILDSLIQKTKSSEFESLSFSKMFKNVNVSSSFILADLIDKRISENEDLTNALNAADVVLMVKLTSFHSTKAKSQIVTNVCEAMRKRCILVFIDCPYPKECFQSVSCVRKIYKKKLKYQFDSSSCPVSKILNIKKSRATVAVFVKV
ncbi:hypothetical protein X975_06927, partial [Stegodyphus mimosarum]